MPLNGCRLEAQMAASVLQRSRGTSSSGGQESLASTILNWDPFVLEAQSAEA